MISFFKRKPAKPREPETLGETIRFMVLLALGVLLFRSLVLQPFNIPSESMMPRLLVGDYLFAIASNEMALAPDPRVIRVFADGVQRICEAELSPVMDVEPTNEALEQYYAKIGGKTAALFEGATRAGMICGGGSEEEIEALGQFGYEVGLAFQIVDDVLDFSADSATLGKPAGHDVQEGTITMPLILAVQAGGSAILHEVAHTDHPSDSLVAQAIAEVRRVGGTQLALDEARKLIVTAVKRLDRFEDSPAKTALIDLAEFALRRLA